jgi:peptidoglycan L-alanyl-D-glutamate endopeptidase CwlK
MPEFSERSRKNLNECDADLQQVLNEAIKHFDFTVFTGHRTREEQQKMLKQGKSQLGWPDSKHNAWPSKAVDIAPYPIGWEDRERATYLAGWIMAIAAMKGINLRWGGDWDQDTQVKDNSFDDLWHFEIVEKDDE